MRIKSIPRVQKFLVACLLGLSVSQQALAECELTSTWEQWEPYQFQKETEITGLDNDLVKAIFKQADCKVNFVKRPWARALKEIEAGTIDFASGASMNDERAQFAHFSIPYRDETMVLIVRKGEASKYDLRKITDISGIKFELGVVRDYYYGEDHKLGLENPDYKKKISEVKDDTANLKKLVAKRIDGVLIDKYVGPYLAKQEGIFEQIEVHPVYINSDNIYLMFSKKTVTPVQVEQFNAAIDALKTSGEFDEILQGYLK
jgi:polar amino acid transport system substrate-binding protein